MVSVRASLEWRKTASMRRLSKKVSATNRRTPSSASPLGQTGEQRGPETSPLPRVGNDESHLGVLVAVGETIEPTHANDLVVMDGDHRLSVPMVHVGEPVELLVAQLRMHREEALLRGLAGKRVMEAVEPSLVTRVHRFEIDDRAVMEHDRRER